MLLTHLIFHSLCGLGLGLYALVLIAPTVRPVRAWYARQAARAAIPTEAPTT